MNSYEWRRDPEPYLTAIVLGKTSHRQGSWAAFYNVYAANGRKYWDIREDRLVILAQANP